MIDYAVYHNPKTMGYDIRFGEPRILTSKTNLRVPCRVWLFSSRMNGKKKEYFLGGWFMASHFNSSASEGFDFELVGDSWGHWYQENARPVISDHPWFPEFLQSQGNFAFGCNQIHSRFVHQLSLLYESEENQKMTY